MRGLNMFKHILSAIFVCEITRVKPFVQILLCTDIQLSGRIIVIIVAEINIRDWKTNYVPLTMGSKNFPGSLLAGWSW